VKLPALSYYRTVQRCTARLAPAPRLGFCLGHAPNGDHPQAKSHGPRSLMKKLRSKRRDSCWVGLAASPVSYPVPRPKLPSLMTEMLISCPSLANVSPWVTPGQQQENSILKRNVDFFSSAARFQNSLHTPPPLYNPNGLLFFSSLLFPVTQCRRTTRKTFS
jgi:hypothetical protein